MQENGMKALKLLPEIRVLGSHCIPSPLTSSPWRPLSFKRSSLASLLCDRQHTAPTRKQAVQRGLVLIFFLFHPLSSFQRGPQETIHVCTLCLIRLAHPTVATAPAPAQGIKVAAVAAPAHFQAAPAPAEAATAAAAAAIKAPDFFVSLDAFLETQFESKAKARAVADAFRVQYDALVAQQAAQ
jgi:hypothetical protein